MSFMPSDRTVHECITSEAVTSSQISVCTGTITALSTSVDEILLG